MAVDEILNLLCDEISKNEAQNYISQLKFDEKLSNDDKVVFTAPNDILAKFIQTKYSQKIAHFFEVKNGIRPEIKIINQKSKTNNKKYSSNLIKTQSSVLNPEFVFDNFVVGNSNQFAYSLAKDAAQNPGQKYNPIFIYGSTGLGKTHLLQSIGNYCLEKNKSVICVTAEQFMNDFTFALNTRNTKDGTMSKFKEKYRNCDVLLIDDVQFFSRSEAVQEEFFHTFNAIREKQGQIVLTSDKAPKLLHGFEERLKSRFESGLSADITPPELETKIKIIKMKCQFDGIDLNDEIINYIAINMGDNIREIEGALTTINAYANLMHQNITIEFAKNIIKDQIKAKKENISLENIIKIVAKETNVKIADIKSKNKTKKIVDARRICIYLAKNLTPNSMPQLAIHFGLKDHSAVSHNIKKINEIMDKDSYFKATIEELKNKIVSKE
nr:chromosomal replication initiator protein DnaA [Campylobacter sp.]